MTSALLQPLLFPFPFAHGSPVTATKAGNVATTDGAEHANNRSTGTVPVSVTDVNRNSGRAQNVSFDISSHAAQRYPRRTTRNSSEKLVLRRDMEPKRILLPSFFLFPVCSSLLSAVAAAVSTGTVTVPVSVTDVDPNSDRRWVGRSFL